MAEMKTLNGYEVVDAKAREDIEKLKAQELDLSAYYTKTEVDAKDKAIQSNLNSHNHDDKYAAKTHKHSYNDLTDKPEIPSTTGLATEQYVDDAIAGIEIPEGTEGTEVIVTKLNTYDEITAIIDAGLTPVYQGIYTPSMGELYLPLLSKPTSSQYLFCAAYPGVNQGFYFINCSDLNGWDASIVKMPFIEEESGSTDLTGYATEDYVDEAIAQAQLGGSEVDLSEYAKKSEIPDVSGFISEIPSEYITETELDEKGYITEHQSLEGLATEDYVTQAIEDALSGIAQAEGGAY